ncbi:MAG: hypothetical protein KIT81_02375 [Alphaproteobacteria bacterium]|nr:hypothetical protein [Alphaproteobacteria bacterium]
MAALLACALLAGCATRIDTSQRNTDPPQIRLGSYSRVLTAPLVLHPKVEVERESEAVQRIEKGLAKCLSDTLGAMPLGGTAPASPALLVTPEIVEMKKVSVGMRLLAGPFAGSSAILLRLTFRDTGRDEVIASPVFFARGNAIGGSYSAGATDNRMLTRIVTLACRYMQQHR